MNLDQKSKHMPRCPRCSKGYRLEGSRDRGAVTTEQHIPLVLHCGHTFCSKCLQDAASREVTSITCLHPSCKNLSPLSVHGSVKSLAVDVYTVGLMSLSQNPTIRLHMQEVEYVKSVATVKPSVHIKARRPARKCPECQMKEVSCTCRQCRVSMCGLCFDRIHSNSNVLKKHQAIPLSDAMTGDITEDLDSAIDAALSIPAQQQPVMVCTEHANRVLEFFCQTDETLLCSHCMLFTEHKQHQVIPVELHKERTAMRTMFNKATSALRQSRESCAVLSGAVLKGQETAHVIMEEIRSHFSRLHSTLQARENILCSQVRHSLNEETQTIEEMKVELQSTMRNLGSVLTDARIQVAGRGPLIQQEDGTLVSELMDQSMLEKTLKDLDTLASKPCCASQLSTSLAQSSSSSIASSATDSAYVPSLNCELPLEPLTSHILNHGVLHGTVIEPVKLLSVSDVTDKVDALSDAASDISSETSGPVVVDRRRIKGDETSSVTSQESDDQQNIGALQCNLIGLGSRGAGQSARGSRSVRMADGDLEDDYKQNSANIQRVSVEKRSGNKSKIKRRLIGKQSADHQEIAMVTHIRSPCHFMINLSRDLSSLQSLARSIKVYCNSLIARSSEVPSSVRPGDMVLVKFSVDGEWYRARIITVNQCRPITCEVFYIDYGNTEIVTLDRMRNIRARFLRDPGYAILCSLVDIIPAHGADKWSTQSVKDFARLTRGRMMFVKGIRETGEISYVDVSGPVSENVEIDGPASTRDALVFLGHAVLVTSPETNRVVDISSGTKRRYFLKPMLPTVGEKLAVTISFIVSPNDFFVQLVGDETRYLAQLSDKLQKTYKSKTADSSYQVVSPMKGQVCAAQFSVDMKWYRAEVLDLPEAGQVTVRFVDFGNSETISVWKVRQLLDKFLIVPTQAIHCTMADVVPLFSDWSEQVLLYMDSLSKFQCQAIVEKIFGDQLSVYLYTDDKLQTANQLLVLKGFARATGPCRYTSEILSGDVCDRLRTFKSQSASAIKAGLGADAVEVPRPRSRHSEPIGSLLPRTAAGVRSCSKPAAVISTVSAAERDASSAAATDMMATCPRVSVSHVISPGRFYVQQVKDLQELATMMKDLANSLGNKSTAASTAAASAAAASKAAASTTADSTAAAATKSSDTITTSASTASTSADDATAVLTSDAGSSVDSTVAKDLGSQNSDLESAGGGVWRVGDVCAVWSSTESNSKLSRWFRGRVVSSAGYPEPSESGKAVYEVLLIDYGMSVKVSLTELHHLDNRFTMLPMAATLCHLGDVTPAGDIHRWSKTASEVFQYIVSDTLFYIVPLADDVKPMNDSLSVDLLMEVRVKGDALSPDQYQLDSVSSQLKDRGLALRKRKRATDNSTQNLHNTEDRSLKLQETLAQETKSETSESNIDKRQNVKIPENNLRRALFVIPEPTVSSNTASDDTVSLQTESNAVRVWRGETDYLPPELPTESMIRLAVVYVEDDGSMYGQEVKNDMNVLYNLMTHVQDVYGKSLPDDGCDWSVGQPIVAKYREDGQFYRARVLSNDLTGGGGILVRYVDFGNTELVAESDLRWESACLHVPVQCYQCVLDDIEPVEAVVGGSWNKSLIETLRSVTVGQMFNAVIKRSPQSGSVLHIDLRTPEDNIDIGAYLCQHGLAAHSSDRLVSDDDDDEDGTSVVSESGEEDNIEVLVTASCVTVRDVSGMSSVACGANAHTDCSSDVDKADNSSIPYDSKHQNISATSVQQESTQDSTDTIPHVSDEKTSSGSGSGDSPSNGNVSVEKPRSAGELGEEASYEYDSEVRSTSVSDERDRNIIKSEPIHPDSISAGNISCATPEVNKLEGDVFNSESTDNDSKGSEDTACKSAEDNVFTHANSVNKLDKNTETIVGSSSMDSTEVNSRAESSSAVDDSNIASPEVARTSDNSSDSERTSDGCANETSCSINRSVVEVSPKCSVPAPNIVCGESLIGDSAMDTSTGNDRPACDGSVTRRVDGVSVCGGGGSVSSEGGVSVCGRGGSVSSEGSSETIVGGCDGDVGGAATDLLTQHQLETTDLLTQHQLETTDLLTQHQLETTDAQQHQLETTDLLTQQQLETTDLLTQHQLETTDAQQQSSLTPTSQYTNLSPLCADDVLVVTVTHVDVVGIVYIQQIIMEDSSDAQVLESNARLTNLLSICNYYQSQLETCRVIRTSQLYIGMPCVAQCSADECWYRAEITAMRHVARASDAMRLDDDDECDVDIIFIDYGSRDVIKSCHHLRGIPEQHMALPMMSIPCRLVGLDPHAVTEAGLKLWSPAKVQDICSLVAEQILIAVVKEVQEGIPVVCLYGRNDYMTAADTSSLPLVYSTLVSRAPTPSTSQNTSTLTDSSEPLGCDSDISLKPDETSAAANLSWAELADAQ